tara:strand:- start:3429 stop:3596 length:168 start_codon:yes stop_codon:yes gene_type:complete
MIDFNKLAQPAPEQRDQFIAEESREEAKILADGLRDLLRIMAEAEYRKLRGYSDD